LSDKERNFTFDAVFSPDDSKFKVSIAAFVSFKFDLPRSQFFSLPSFVSLISPFRTQISTPSTLHWWTS
jgi:hypothetical protein